MDWGVSGWAGLDEGVGGNMDSVGLGRRSQGPPSRRTIRASSEARQWRRCSCVTSVVADRENTRVSRLDITDVRAEGERERVTSGTVREGAEAEGFRKGVQRTISMGDFAMPMLAVFSKCGDNGECKLKASSSLLSLRLLL